MSTITAGEVRECCRTGGGLRILEQTERLIVQRCETPAVDGLLDLEGVRVCGRRHFRAKLVGLGARAAGARLGD
jgi:hypothetical protein